MQIEILINSNSYQTRSLFFGRYLGSSRKVVKPRNDREEDHTQVWHRIYRVVGSFFLCACILWNVFSWKTNRSLKKSEVYSFIFFQLLEFKQLQRRRQQQSHLTSFRFCMQNKKINNQKFKVLRTQTFSHVTSNSKRKGIKFKLICKFKMLRKLKQ